MRKGAFSLWKRLEILAILLMRNNSNWFESPHPTSFHFAHPHATRDLDPDDEQPRPLPTPIPLAHHPLSPFIQYHEQPHQGRASEHQQGSQLRSIMNRLVFSSEESEQEMQTPEREEKMEEEIHTTGRKSNNDKLGGGRRSRPKEKGLRGISFKAYAVVLETKVTSYKEVANRLLREFSLGRPGEGGTEQTNVKRRVYDALNVLIAVGVLRKDGRRIINDKQGNRSPRHLSEEVEMLQRKLALREESVQEKRRKLEQAEEKLRAVRGLLRRNQQNKAMVQVSGEFIAFPFIGVTNYTSCQFEVVRAEFVQLRFDVMVRPFGDMDSLAYITP